MHLIGMENPGLPSSVALFRPRERPLRQSIHANQVHWSSLSSWLPFQAANAGRDGQQIPTQLSQDSITFSSLLRVFDQATSTASVGHFVSHRQ
jgi:hypothetical protein